MPSDGCIFKSTKSRYYQAKFTIRPGEKPVYRSTGETNKSLAVDRLREMMKEARGNASTSRDASKITLADFCRLPDEGESPHDQGGEYWQYVVANRAGSTQARYRDILRTQILPRFGAYRFAAVTPRMIETWKQERLTQVQKGTVKKELDVLSNVFKIARKIYRYTRENPVTDVERPKVPQKKMRIPSPVAVKAFLDAVATYKPDYFPYLLALYMSGGRVDEIRHLEPTDVRDDATILTIRVKAGWSPKDAEDRDIPLVDPLRSVVLTQLADHPGFTWLFPRTDGRTIYCKRCGRRENHLGNVRKTILTVARLAKIPEQVTHHMLRHCCNSHAKRLGAQEVDVMELLGQRSTKVNRLYTHAEWSGIQAATERLGQSVGMDSLRLWLDLTRKAPSTTGTE